MGADTIGDKMEGLRKGKADVLEADHTLLLGWSDKLLAIVDQICNANASEGGRPIVILAEKDKVQMEEAIDRHSPNLRGSRVICRHVLCSEGHSSMQEGAVGYMKWQGDSCAWLCPAHVLLYMTAPGCHCVHMMA